MNEMVAADAQQISVTGKDDQVHLGLFNSNLSFLRRKLALDIAFRNNFV